MAKGDKYLDYLKTLEQAAKPWSASLGAFLKMKCTAPNILINNIVNLLLEEKS